jgi:hypothetical protein
MVSDGQLIDDLKAFAEELGETPTFTEMNDSGLWAASTYVRSFGTWNAALQEAGLEVNKSHEVSKEQLISDLQQFAEELDRTPTKREMNNLGPWGKNTYITRLGTWNAALQEAGLKINRLGSEELAGIGEQAYGSGYHSKRSEVLERDSYECRVCGEIENIHCHHIKPRREFEKIGDSNTLDNLIILCNSCHSTFEGKWQNADPDEFAERAKE